MGTQEWVLRSSGNTLTTASGRRRRCSGGRGNFHPAVVNVVGMGVVLRKDLARPLYRHSSANARPDISGHMPSLSLTDREASPT